MSSLVGISRANFIAGLLVIAGCLASASTIAQTQFQGDILLGRPTDESISVSVMSFRDTQVYIEYGSASGDYTNNSQVQEMSAGDVYVFEIDGLNGDAEYFYRVRFQSNTSQIVEDYANTPEYSFNTAKSPGSTFSFAVEADPHLGARTRFEKWCGNGCDREAASDKIYARTVENMLAYDPDFLVDLGDFFMTSQNIGNALFPIQERTRGMPVTEAEVLDDVLYVRSLFTQGGPSIPIMLVQGNHEAEDGNRLDGTPNNVAVWAVNARKKYFPSPTDNGFYSGPTTEYDFIGRQDGHYAWEWGDALFVALDPFWEPNRSSGSWGKSLGREQYDWLKETLEDSDAAFKFVFLHHLIGGCDNAFGGSRGGALCSDYFEWGGRTPFDYEERWLGNTPFGGQVQDSPDPVPPVRRVDSSTESYDFDENRPGWGVPIQQILLDNGVQIVFHGHDHLYVRETHPSGLIYHEIPQPSREAPDGQGLLLQAANENYDYEEGVVVSGGGFVNVTVSPDQVRVDYVRTADECSSAGPCYDIADSYTVDAN